jgi:Xaa-Pro aminopeptidase
MPFSQLPVIPECAYPERWQAVQRLMENHDLDLIIACADDRAVFGPAHARWLADIPIHFEPACVLTPRSGLPALLTGPETVEYALRVGKIRDVRAASLYVHPDEDYPYATIHDLADIVADVTKGQSVRKVGVAGKSLLNADTWAAWMATLPQAQWIDVENRMCDLRAVKSEAEIAVIRYAYRIAQAGFDAAVNAIGVGVTEREVAAEADAAMRRMGAEGTGIDTIVASGPNTRPILARSTFRRIEKNEIVLLTIAPRYEGYHAAIGRPVFVGDPGAEITTGFETAVRAQETCFRALRPGIEGRSVEAVGRRIVGEAGLGDYFLYSGVHSVGVIEFEPPIFGPSSDAMIRENMVISIDIPLFDAPWGGLRIEDGYLITATGAEKLHDTPFRIDR